MANRLGAIWRSMREHGLAAGIAGLVGFLLGVLLKAPLFTWWLPEKAEDMIATMVSAAIAVLGAALVSQAISNRERNAARRFVFDVLQPVVDSMEKVDKLGSNFGHASAPDRDEFPRACARAHIFATEAKARLDRMAGCLQGLGPREVMAIADAEKYLGELDKKLSELQHMGSRRRDQIGPANAAGMAAWAKRAANNLRIVQRRITRLG